ncbi:hypothetical protein B296_00020518 [Ensete ventricosum]|uniref:Uncharacterized protein n=1 Tax=Ensete ventricosum TaxID=4639 RepID=A0A426YJI1_ENSVE|nr:hypothetical protein B296_00020518 [Ensete ventricosum]
MVGIPNNLPIDLLCSQFWILSAFSLYRSIFLHETIFFVHYHYHINSNEQRHLSYLICSRRRQFLSLFAKSLSLTSKSFYKTSSVSASSSPVGSTVVGFLAPLLRHLPRAPPLLLVPIVVSSNVASSAKSTCKGSKSSSLGEKKNHLPFVKYVAQLTSLQSLLAKSSSPSLQSLLTESSSPLSSSLSEEKNYLSLLLSWQNCLGY